MYLFLFSMVEFSLIGKDQREAEISFQEFFYDSARVSCYYYYDCIVVCLYAFSRFVVALIRLYLSRLMSISRCKTDTPPPCHPHVLFPIRDVDILSSSPRFPVKKPQVSSPRLAPPIETQPESTCIQWHRQRPRPSTPTRNSRLPLRPSSPSIRRQPTRSKSTSQRRRVSKRSSKRRASSRRPRRRDALSPTPRSFDASRTASRRRSTKRRPPYRAYARKTSKRSRATPPPPKRVRGPPPARTIRRRRRRDAIRSPISTLRATSAR